MILTNSRMNIEMLVKGPLGQLVEKIQHICYGLGPGRLSSSLSEPVYRGLGPHTPSIVPSYHHTQSISLTIFDPLDLGILLHQEGGWNVIDST